MMLNAKMPWARTSLLILIISTVSCTHTPTRTPDRPGLVMLADDIGFELLPPADFGQSLMLTQAAEIRFAGESHELIFYTEITEDQVVIVGTLSTGTRIFTINYDGSTVSSEGYDRLYEHIEAEYFLADLQMAQWPLNNLKASLATHSRCFASGECTLTDSVENGVENVVEGIVERVEGGSRSLTHQSMPVLSIYYSDSPRYRGTTEIIHHQRDYSLKITTIDVEVL